MNTNETFGDDPTEAIDLWRRLLETEIDLEDAHNGADIVGDLDNIDENELAGAQATVFARLGINARKLHDELVAAFMIDLENWRIEASAPILALARDVGSLAETVEVSVPELRAEGLDSDVVELECDLDESGRICDLTVMIPTPDETRPLTVLLIEPDGEVHTARVSSLGVARFSELAIEPTAGVPLRFELRG